MINKGRLVNKLLDGNKITRCLSSLSWLYAYPTLTRHLLFLAKGIVGEARLKITCRALWRYITLWSNRRHHLRFHEVYKHRNLVRYIRYAD